MSTMPTNAAATTTIATTALSAASPEESGSSDGGGNSLPGPHNNNGREARNLAEKHRRDKLNASIQELATMVPHVAEATRRLDKTAVLRFAAHGLRLQYVFGKTATTCKRRGSSLPSQQQQQPCPLLSDALLQLLDSFFITLTCHGQIVLVSTSVETLLGHCQSDLYGQNILQITHADDQALLRQQLIPHDMETLFRSTVWQQTQQRMEEDETTEGGDDDNYDNECGCAADFHATDNTPPASPRTQMYLDDLDRRLRADRRCFVVRMARAGLRTEAARQYEHVKIDGCFRRSDCSHTAGSYPIVSQLIRRSRSNATQAGLLPGANSHCPQHDVIAQAALHGISGNDIVLVGMARVLRTPKLMTRLLDANQLEYRTRHLIDGRIVDCDQRIGLVAGYMKDEVFNLSPFSFIHLDDVRWVIVALRQMYDCNNDYGESCYRLITRNGNFIYLQTKGYLEINETTKEVRSFVCINTLLDEAEGRRRVQAMKDKFSVIIKTKIPNSQSLQDVPASQNPQQLERIVLYLIENLQQRDVACPLDGSASPQLQTPPLALVPPEPASVRNSITKSVSVINVTAARNLPRTWQSSPANSYQGSDASSCSPTSSLDHSEETADASVIQPVNGTTAVPRPSVLKMHSVTLQPAASRTSSAQVSVLKRLRSTISPAASSGDSSAISPAKRSPQCQRQQQQRIIHLPSALSITTTTSNHNVVTTTTVPALGCSHKYGAIIVEQRQHHPQKRKPEQQLLAKSVIGLTGDVHMQH